MTRTITLVTNVFLSKQEALDALSRSLGLPVDHTDPADSTIRLSGGVVVSIEVPKFGEDLPLALDLTGDDQKAVSIAADELSKRVAADLSWDTQVLGQP